jgi:hypothetical protein
MKGVGNAVGLGKQGQLSLIPTHRNRIEQWPDMRPACAPSTIVRLFGGQTPLLDACRYDADEELRHRGTWFNDGEEAMAATLTIGQSGVGLRLCCSQ